MRSRACKYSILKFVCQFFAVPTKYQNYCLTFNTDSFLKRHFPENEHWHATNCCILIPTFLDTREIRISILATHSEGKPLLRRVGGGRGGGG